MVGLVYPSYLAIGRWQIWVEMSWIMDTEVLMNQADGRSLYAMGREEGTLC